MTLADIRQPSVPVLAATIRHGTGSFTNLTAPAALAWSGNLLAIAAVTDNAVTLVDMANPVNPVWLAPLKDGQEAFEDLAEPTGLKFQGSVLWIAANDDSAVNAVDVSTPTASGAYATARWSAPATATPRKNSNRSIPPRSWS